MATMFSDVEESPSGGGGGGNAPRSVNLDALKSEVRAALISRKVNACPITMRHAWHMAGTFDKSDNTGGTDGATIRFSPEKDDAANAGLHIIRDLLAPVKRAHPEISHADLFVIASSMAIEFVGGPLIPIALGRTDDADGARCPANGRLPDALQGAEHLREVFGRMGLNDQEIVALSGGHTLGSAHRVRSGFDGQWTTAPLRFDNEYFVNLLERKWKERNWDGPKQFEDAGTDGGTLMMLPTDIALIEDAAFRKHVERYARDADAFYADFAAAYGKLLALGCADALQPGASRPPLSEREQQNRKFRHLAMHGFVPPARKMHADGGGVDARAADPSSGRTALHFAAFWGHVDMVRFLLEEVGLAVDATDFAGDTPLHDAAAHGHTEVARLLVASGADVAARNGAGASAREVAENAHYPETAAAIRGSKL